MYLPLMELVFPPRTLVISSSLTSPVRLWMAVAYLPQGKHSGGSPRLAAVVL